MKIGFLIYGSLDAITGGNIYDRELRSVLQDLGHSTEILPITRHTYYRNVLHNFTGVLVDKIKTAHLDLLLEDELVHPSLFYLNHWIRSRFHIPIVAIVHNLTTYSSERPGGHCLSRKLEQWYLKSLDGYIGVSEKTLNQVQSMVGHKSPSTIAYPAGNRFGVEISENQVLQRSKQPGPLRILFLGNITPNKQLDVLLKTIKSLPLDSFTLDVIGQFGRNSDYQVRCTQLVQQYNLQDSVHFYGSINGLAKMIKILEKSHVLVLPSQSEGFPIVMMEAAGFGIPSVITSESAADEFIQHTVNGFLVNPSDVNAIAEYLQLLHSDRDYLAEVSVAALQGYHRHTTWNETGQKVNQFLTQSSGGKAE